ncbi:MAG: hypothetical protein DMG07_23465 [Acidobacteria bacterium]|nr:MAG: hypothetical protein DMG07_23465 [Acidobacteriota bacterium]
MVEQRKKTSTRRAFVKHSANAAAAAVVGPMVLRQPVFQANDPKQPLSAQQSSGRSQGVARDKAIPPRPYDLFAMQGDRIITEEDDFGIINGLLTMGVSYRDVGTLSGLFAPPYASSDFLLELRLFGEKVSTKRFDWRPTEVRREGQLQGIAVSTSTILIHGKRAGILSVTFRNTTPKARVVPIQFNIIGDITQTDPHIGLDYVKYWGFARPVTTKSKTSVVVEGRWITLHNSSGAVVLASDFDNLTREELSEWSSHWVTTINIQPGEQRTHYIAFALGPREESQSVCEHLIQDPSSLIQRSIKALVRQSEDLLSSLPVFEASNPLLTDYYRRSLQHLLLNRWTVPDFVLNPYYSTGSIKGGCVGCYLWDHGILSEMMPLYDPNAVRAHVKQFLKVDITKHYLFNPVDGEGYGPTYLVNQEKIIGCIYHYVLHTGDVSFLREQINGKSILDWVFHYATFGDDLSKPAVLIDYGKDVSHLELRHQYKYDHVLPDVNGGRYTSYIRACNLATLAGKQREDLNARPGPLKELLKKTLWNPEHQWLGFQSDKDSLELRYTNIIFTLIGTGVLDRETELGLLSHLNEREFLSAYGLHSISKLDPAYDQVDIDHGGGGSYVAFPALIAESLYKGGYSDPAEDILERTLWWGQRLPYWGDSMVANQINYRRETPLQCALDAAAGTQCVIFGMCGVRVELNGDIVVNPHPPKFSPSISLKGVKIRGTSFDIAANRSDFEVKVNQKIMRSKIGVPVVLTTKG